MYNFSALKPLGSKWSDQQQDAVRQFAHDNGWTFEANLGQTYSKLNYSQQVVIPAWMRDNVFASEQVNGVSAFINGYPVFMFADNVVTYTTTSYRDPVQKPHYSHFGVIVVELNKLFPQLVLDSNKNDKFFMKMHSTSIASGQKINLEGKFSKYFDFYAPKGINANTLTVLAPNFMQMLIDSSATFDVEIFGNRLFILTQDPLYSERVMAEALAALEEQLTYMKRLETSWNYQPLIQPFDVLKQKTVMNARFTNLYSVKIGPLRISLIWIILAGFVLIVVLMQILSIIFPDVVQTSIWLK